MNTQLRKRPLVAAALMSVLAVFSSACTPAPPPWSSWEFTATRVTVNDSQDEIRGLFGECIPATWLGGRKDEPYVMNIATRVKIGVPDSADGFVVSSRSSNPHNVPAGASRVLTGPAGAPAVFTGIDRLDILDLLDGSRPVEVFLIYTWVMEEDVIPVNIAANDVKNLLILILNLELAQGSMPSDPDQFVDEIMDRALDIFTLLLSNIPQLGLGDDVGGGAFNIGIPATGVLADIVDASIASATIAPFPLSIRDLPPDVKHVDLLTMSGTTTFAGQVFDQYGDGVHTYDFQANQV